MISPVISTVAFCVWSAICDISIATTAKPFPASPALAASILALSASRLVCDVISLIISIIEFICDMYLSSSDNSLLTNAPESTAASTFFTRFSICSLPSSIAFFVFLILSIIAPEPSATFSILFLIFSVCSSWFWTACAVSVEPILISFMFCCVSCIACFNCEALSLISSILAAICPAAFLVFSNIFSTRTFCSSIFLISSLLLVLLTIVV